MCLGNVCNDGNFGNSHEVTWKVGNFLMNSMSKLRVFPGKIFKTSPEVLKNCVQYNMRREK